MRTLLTTIFILSVNIIIAQDKFNTQYGSFTIHFVGHGSLYIDYNNTIIHIDPWSRVGDYPNMPDADFILITHKHRDHLDKAAISNIQTSKTKIIAPKSCTENLKDFTNIQYLENDESLTTIFGEIRAFPAYNIKHKRDSGQPFHPKGEGNGYVLKIDDQLIYIAGDTENIPEMKNLKNIDIAFLPMNLPYTMTPEMAADAAKNISPKILYPYHFGDTDTRTLIDLLKNTNIDLRIRSLK